jgi:hypothetical protein
LAVMSWSEFFLVVTFIIVLELVSNNIMEVVVYGRSIGVSTVALLVAAVFWTWLWGPLGLVLSTPLTSCLLVLGHHVPGFDIFRLLLGDEPVLERYVGFYQRLLARDTDEAAELVEHYLKDHAAEQVYDELLLPALLLAKKDHQREDLSDIDDTYIRESTLEIFHDVLLPAHGEKPAIEELPRARLVILGIPCQDATDATILHMFKEFLEPGRFQWIVASPKNLRGRPLARLQQKKPGLIFLATLPAQGIARTRILCKKIRAQFPETPILVGCWSPGLPPDLVRERLVAAGASAVGMTFLETRRLLYSQLEPTPEETPGVIAAKNDGRESVVAHAK